MFDVAIITLVVASLLLLVAASQPVAARLHVPPTVILAALGVGFGSLATFLLATPLTNAFNDIVAPIVTLPIRSSVFLYVLLPLLLFQATITIQARRMLEDIAPILLLAVVAVFVAAAAVGYSLIYLFEVAPLAALLLGAIVATTDPSAVVAIFRDIGAPARLTRLVEGESLLNDAAAIALFSLLLAATLSGEPLDFAALLQRFEDSSFLQAFLLDQARRLGTAGKLLFPIPERGLAERLYRVTAKTLLVWGESDRLIAPAYADAFLRHLPEAKLVRVARAGHMAPYEQTRAVVDAIAGLT